MFYVKVSGETLGDLKLGLEAKLAEIENRAVKTPRSFAVVSEGSDVGDDGMEEVESPFAGQTASIDTSVVIDNEKDSEGLPWDSRIHSGGKTKNGDGTWKKKKGVDAALLIQVKAELLNRGTTPVAAPVITPVAPVQQQSPSTIINQTPATPSLPSAAPTLPQVQTGHTLESFQANFALIISNLITQGKLTQEYVNSLKDFFKVQEIWQANAEQQAACFSEFVNCGIIQRVG